MNAPTQEQLNRWYDHQSNKEAWVEREQARQDEIQEDTTSMEEKLEALFVDKDFYLNKEYDTKRIYNRNKYNQAISQNRGNVKQSF